MGALISTTTALQDSTSALQNASSNLQGQVSSIQTRVQTVCFDVARHDAALAQNSARVNNFENRVANIEQSIDALSNAQASSGSGSDSASSDQSGPNPAVDQRLDALESKVDDQANRVSSIETNIDSLVSLVAILAEQLESNSIKAGNDLDATHVGPGICEAKKILLSIYAQIKQRQALVAQGASQATTIPSVVSQTGQHISGMQMPAPSRSDEIRGIKRGSGQTLSLLRGRQPSMGSMAAPVQVVNEAPQTAPIPSQFGFQSQPPQQQQQPQAPPSAAPAPVQIPLAAPPTQIASQPAPLAPWQQTLQQQQQQQLASQLPTSASSYPTPLPNQHVAVGRQRGGPGAPGVFAGVVDQNGMPQPSQATQAAPPPASIVYPGQQQFTPQQPQQPQYPPQQVYQAYPAPQGGVAGMPSQSLGYIQRPY